PLSPARRWLRSTGARWCALALRALGASHDRHAAPASLALAFVRDAARYGRVTLDSRGRVGRFEEKRARGPGWVNAGVYLLQRERVAGLPERVPLSLERDVLPGWGAAGGEVVAGWVAAGEVRGFRGGRRFLDIGTPESYAAAEGFFTQTPGGIDRRERAAV